MTKEETHFLATGAKINDAVAGKLFGKPCFKIKGKAFACFFENEMVFKLQGTDHQEALSLDGTQLFDPSGKNRPMKEWVQVPIDYEELWEQFAEAAAKYVGNLRDAN